MRMREWCLVTESGSVVNMALTARVDGPAGPVENGLAWVPIELVPDFRLTSYRYWNERP